MSSEPKVYSSWEDSFQLVKTYVRDHGTFPITTDKEHGGSWIHVQRMNYKRHILSGQQIALLRTLPPWKVWEATPWKIKFKRVKAYFDSNCEKSLLPTDFSFSDWWNDCKKDFKNDTLEEDHLILLRTIPQWVEWEHKNTQKTKIQFVPWQESYQRIKAYVDEHHTFPCARKSTEARWVDTQKYRFKCNKLQPEQIELLQQLPPWVEWTSSSRAQTKQVRRTWDDHYNELLTYTRTHHKLPPKKDKTSISYWVVDLKKDYQHHRLLPEQLQRLQGLSVWRHWVSQFNRKKQDALLKREQIQGLV